MSPLTSEHLLTGRRRVRVVASARRGKGHYLGSEVQMNSRITVSGFLVQTRPSLALDGSGRILTGQRMALVGELKN